MKLKTKYMDKIRKPTKHQVGLLQALRDKFEEDFNAANFIAHATIVPSTVVKQCIRNDYLG